MNARKGGPGPETVASDMEREPAVPCFFCRSPAARELAFLRAYERPRIFLSIQDSFNTQTYRINHTD
jgi:hypothetical protein